MIHATQAPTTNPYVRRFMGLRLDDAALVGAKNAGLGELTTALHGVGVSVPEGFAVTASAYRSFVEANNLNRRILPILEAWHHGVTTLHQAGRSIRRLFVTATFPPEIEEAIRQAYGELSALFQTAEVDVAVRSSATFEDPTTAGFAGLEETFLNISGAQNVLEVCRKCYASLFTDRAIKFRADHDIDQQLPALSLGVQKMVRSDLGGAGMIFSPDPDTRFPCLVLITAAWGLGKSAELGTVQPDEYEVFTPVLRQGLCPIIEKRLGGKAQRVVYGADAGKAVITVETPVKDRRAFVLTDAEITRLAGWAVMIEEHFDRPMEIEWAKDGLTSELFIVQARRETMLPHESATGLHRFTMKERPVPLLTGSAVGNAIVSGRICLMQHPSDSEKFVDGSILVARMTDPDWVPIMKRAAGIITEYGGRTSHQAIVSRDLRIPAVVGAGHAVATLDDSQVVTLSCVEGELGYVYAGQPAFEATLIDRQEVPETRTKVLLDIGDPDAALHWWRLPCQGIGLARMEFMIGSLIKVHPMALVHFDRLADTDARKQIQALTREYADKTDFFVEHLARGIAKIAASQHPRPVVVRMSDFTTSAYARLIGGKQFEAVEENPLLGLRGASRYYSECYRAGFALECRAIQRVREGMGLANVAVMIPFCRTLDEADRVLAELASNGLSRGEHGPRIYVTCEIPSNAILANGFAARFDGFSIDGNDLTRLALGIDRDTEQSGLKVDERDEAVKWMIQRVITAAHAAGKTVDFQGQAPSDHPDFAAFLLEAGVDSITVKPESMIPMKRRIAELEHTLSRSLAMVGG